LGEVDECGGRSIGADGIANLELEYASLQGVVSIGKICILPFALSGEQVGEVGVVEELRSQAGISLKLNSASQPPRRT